jgi:hypothetical protein
MRIVALSALAVTAVAVTAIHPSSARASCAEAVWWGGTTYLGVGVSKRVLALGPIVSGGVEPGCRDTIPGPPVQDTPVRLRTIAGISARVALVRADRPSRIFLAPGFLPQLPDFPLHDAIFGSRTKPVDRPWERPPAKRFFKCDAIESRTVIGRVRNALFSFTLRVSGRDETIFVDVRTRVPHERGSLPRFRAGMRVRVQLTECRRGSHFRYRVADRIDILG